MPSYGSINFQVVVTMKQHALESLKNYSAAVVEIGDIDTSQ